MYSPSVQVISYNIPATYWFSTSALGYLLKSAHAIIPGALFGQYLQELQRVQMEGRFSVLRAGAGEENRGSALDIFNP